jgi:hypothetical protein
MEMAFLRKPVKRPGWKLGQKKKFDRFFAVVVLQCLMLHKTSEVLETSEVCMLILVQYSGENSGNTKRAKRQHAATIQYRID